MKETIKYLKNILKSGDKVVIALSGGPDSMFLTNLLLSIPNIKIIAAHINHKVRKESEEEKEFVRTYCEKNNIIFEYKEITEKLNDNFHNETHHIRYNFFKEIVYKYKANYLMTAHHGDDLMETILMRMVRGSTLRGYAGFKQIVNKEKYTIVRPLINLTKKEIEEYCQKEKIQYVTDMSNYKEKYTRNRYRMQVLPFLKKEDFNVHQKFLNFSQTLLKYDDFVEQEVNKSFIKVFKNNELDINNYNKKENFIKERIILKILNEVYDGDMTCINNKHVNLLLEMIENQKSCYELDFPNDLVVRKSYGKVSFLKKNYIQEYYYIFDKELSLPNGKIIKEIKISKEKSNNITRLLSSELNLPLIVRTKQNGDKMEVKGLNGTKKIKDIFINSKVEKEERITWPIVTDNNGNILWIPGVKKSKFDKDKEEKYDIIIKYI